MEFFLGAFEKEWQARRAALLHERASGRANSIDDEERRRRGSSVASGLPSGRSGVSAPGARPSGHDRGHGRREGTGAPSMRSRFGRLAKGSQPVVVKLASFGGGGRLGAMVSYGSRNGQISIENERGEQLTGRDGISAVRGEWDHLMNNRKESRDIGTFTVIVKDAGNRMEEHHQQARDILGHVLGNRRFAHAVSPRPDINGFAIEGVAVLRDEKGERLTGDVMASEIVQARIDGTDEPSNRSVEFRFTGHGNGTDYGSARLRDLVANHACVVRDQTGRDIADARQASDLVRLEWRDRLHSRKPRDVMHLILSARAGTDVDAFQSAVRDFLGRQFAGHRYVFSVHDPASDPKPEGAGGKRPHVHVHAIVAMRSDYGDRIETSIASFRQWRVTMAESARTNGIDMEMTDRRDRASPPAYHRNQVRPTARLGRTEHEGTSKAGQARYDDKRSDRHSFAETKTSRDYTDIAKLEWYEVAISSGKREGMEFALSQLNRLESGEFDAGRRQSASADHENSLSQYNTHLVILSKVISGGANMQQMNRKEFETYERLVADALDRAERVMPEGQREAFMEIASAAREHVDARREIMEMAETQRSAEAPGEREPAREETPDERWNSAVARHGMPTVEAANRILLEVEHYRDALDHAKSQDSQIDQVSLKASLNLELARAGELGAAGNSLIREVAAVDDALRAAVEAAEQSRDRSENKNKADGTATAGGQSMPKEQKPRDRDAGDDEQNYKDEPDPSEVLNRADRKDERARREAGDTTRTDPARQHVPRMEQLQRDTDERRERDQNDHER